MRLFKILGFVVATTLAGASNDPLEVRPMQISELAPGVHLHVSYQHVESWGWVGSNGLVIFDGDDAYCIDTPWSTRDTKELAEWVDTQGATLRGSLSTHSHDDRSAGIGYLNEIGIPTYASELTNQLLNLAGKPAATVTFPGPDFNWVPDKLTVFHPGGGHTPDNLVVWVNETKILVGGCLIRSLETQSLGYTGDATIGTWADSVRAVISKFPSVQTVLPGHGKVGDMQLLEHTIILAESARNATAEP